MSHHPRWTLGKFIFHAQAPPESGFDCAGFRIGFWRCLGVNVSLAQKREGGCENISFSCPQVLKF